MTSAPIPGDGNDIFYPPSASWLSRAGVLVSYAPEDTMKSFIMLQKTRKQQALMQVNRELSANAPIDLTNFSSDMNPANLLHDNVIDLTENEDYNCYEEAYTHDEPISSAFYNSRSGFSSENPQPRKKPYDRKYSDRESRVRVDLDESEVVDGVDLSASHSIESCDEIENHEPSMQHETDVDGIPCAGKSFDQLLAEALQQTSDPANIVPKLPSSHVEKVPSEGNRKFTRKPIKVNEKVKVSTVSKEKETPSELVKTDISNRSAAASKSVVEEKSNPLGVYSEDKKPGKRPFLRKNQGRAAWCHKTNSSSSSSSVNKKKPDAIPERPVRKIEMGSKFNGAATTVECVRRGPSGFTNSISDDIILVPSSKRSEFKPVVALTKKPANPDTDLEEFELLEKATELSLNGSVSSLAQMDKNQLKNRLEQKLPTVKEASSKLKSTSLSPRSVWFQDEEKWSEEEEEELQDRLQSNSNFTQLKSTKGISNTAELENLAAEIFPKMPPIDKKQSNPLENTSVQASQLRHWVKVLEDEIKRFNNENAALAKLKQEKEEGLKRLQKEIKEFEEFKAKELHNFEEWKESETKKLKKERKLFDEYQKAMKVAPDRKEREEIERLRAEIRELREEMTQKESRWLSSQACLRRHVEEVESERDELLNQVKNLEQKRLELQSRVAMLSSGKSSEASNMSRSGGSDIKGPTLTRTTQAVHFKKAPVIGMVPLSTSSLHTQNELSSKPNPYLVGKLRDSTGSGYYTGDDDATTTTTTTGASSNAGDYHGVNNNAVVYREVPRLPLKETSQTRTLPTSAPFIPSTATTSAPLEIPHQDGTIERHMADGSRHISFPNGSVKKISPDGKLIVVELFNGDVKKNLPDGQEVYYFAQQKVTQTKFPDGTEEFVYPDGRKEILRPTGQREHYSNAPDEGVRVVWPNGDEQMVHPNGLIVWNRGNGQREIHFPNGQREIHSQDSKRRIYPDGTVKIVYQDGSQETRYASGRIRKKDPQGNLILDTRPTPS